MYLETDYIVTPCKENGEYFSGDAKSECDKQIYKLFGKFPKDMCYPGATSANYKDNAVKCAKQLSEDDGGIYVIDEKVYSIKLALGEEVTRFFVSSCEEGAYFYSYDTAYECSDKLPGTKVDTSWWPFGRPFVIETQDAKSEYEEESYKLYGIIPDDMCNSETSFAYQKNATQCAKQLSENDKGIYVVDEKTRRGGMLLMGMEITSHYVTSCEEGANFYSNGAAKECSDKLPGTKVDTSWWPFGRQYFVESKE